jgi:hypothetical protein
MPETLASRAFWPFAERNIFVSFGIISQVLLLSSPDLFIGGRLLLQG